MSAEDLTYCGRVVVSRHSTTSKQLFNHNKVLKSLKQDFVGRDLILENLLIMLRSVRSMLVCGRSSDKKKIVSSTCKRAGFMLVQVDCALVETSSDLFEYILSRMHICLTRRRQRQAKKRKRSEDLNKTRESHFKSQESLGDKMFASLATQGKQALRQRSGSASSNKTQSRTRGEKHLKRNFLRCARANEFVKIVERNMLPSVSRRPNHGCHVALLLSNAPYLNEINRDLLDILMRHMPHRIRVIFLSDMAEMTFLRKDCPTLHVPYLSREDFVETIYREYTKRTTESIPLSCINKTSTDQPKSSVPLSQHFRSYIQLMCTVLQTRGALRDTDELRYLLLTTWPSFRDVAQQLPLKDFRVFVRVALSQRSLIQEIQGCIFAHDKVAPTFELCQAIDSDSQTQIGGSNSSPTIQKIFFAFPLASARGKNKMNSASKSGDTTMQQCIITLHRREQILDFPELMKFILIAAYLCSHIPEADHGRIFSPRLSQQKNRSGQRKRSTSARISIRKTVPSFVVERLIAVCHSIMASHEGVVRELDRGFVLTQLAMLQQMRLIKRTSNETQLNDPRFSANVSQALILAMANSLKDRFGNGFELGRYLAATHRLQ